MLRWRRRTLVPFCLSCAGALVLAAVPGSADEAAWSGLVAVTAGLGLVLVVLAVPVLRHLYAFALHRVGARYAWSHAILATLLVPVGYLGVVALPPLLVADHASRLPRWRRRTALGLELEFLRFGGFLVALAGAGLLALLPGWTGLVLGTLWFAGTVLGTTVAVRRLRPPASNPGPTPAQVPASGNRGDRPIR